MDSSLEQVFITFESVQSLESIAVINVATELCKQFDFIDEIRQHSLKPDFVRYKKFCILYDDHRNSFKELRNSLLKKLSLVPLPDLLKEKVANTLKPVVLEMLEWICYGQKIGIEFLDSLCWTTEGTIDKVKTFRKLVHKDAAQYHVKDLYELACRFWLEDWVFRLWNKLPNTVQNDYCNMMHINFENALIGYWTSTIQNELSRFLSYIKQNYYLFGTYNCNNSINKNMVTLAVKEGNIFAVKYFWNKLAIEERSSNLAQWINDAVPIIKNNVGGYQSNCKYSNVLYFLLPQMHSAEQQKEVLQKHSYDILISLFYDWPWQRFLLPTLQRMWSFLDEEVFIKFLSTVVDIIKENKCTEMIVRELWNDSPMRFKDYFILFNSIPITSVDTDLLCKLLVLGFIEIVLLILNYANVDEKKRIVFSVVENEKVYELIYTDKLFLLDALIDRTLSSAFDIENLKSKVALKYGNKLCSDWVYENNFKMVEKFFDWAFTSQDQIDKFKNEELDKNAVTFEIIKRVGNYELANKFISWCFSTNSEVDEFKKNFSKSRYAIVMIGEENWDMFKKFICWCFVSNEDIKEFKCDLLQSDKISKIIFSSIADRNIFDFPDQLIGWCCSTNEEMKQFKAGFILSTTGLNILQRFVNSIAMCDGYSDFDEWVLTRKFMKFFSPLDKKTIINFKEKVAAHISFDLLSGDDSLRSHQIRQDLFRLIDNVYICYT